ncbi:hypothetical protein ERO13_D09G165000v2 [Gossypium hirsutum]|uniref:Methyltransferase domain-containing protein n=6 Tax=Gossypium TaxID=3633 RepID=A0A0D2NUZ5_GOSRA|nr:probable thiol methyltransferase 2 isoform X2 [Gossypium raimondii]XP_016671015.1 probable thiol methyltransferase 2 isoform X3 [Gossypium hirsutum]KAB2013835.1 hypothetical protein ES319_D09G184500v1 [Gossypium barbadense]TYG54571.1 hypothetical protein ES288_D09G201700v1 [Gossypium darwinii]TYH54815.1 hypothetical protein ES332_D09G197100v1 [Gossypium tomentosum]KAG4130743.1 hypothetical protein ERO13_D09G165000v2 [Gossypium hirsutum]KAG4130744.1 hypothetical protein ERO13_D09G165000v2 [
MLRSLFFSPRIRRVAVPSSPLGPTLAMDNNNRSRTTDSSVQTNPRIQKLQQIVKTDASAGWEESWKQGVTPWDLGCPTPVILHLHHSGSLPMGRVLVPGCGTGYDVVAMACPGRYVVGLDISEEAIKKAKQMSSSLPNADDFTFIKADFFSWRPTDLFDLIFDYTYEEVLHPIGFKAVSIVDNELAIEARKGREKLGRWKRGVGHSSL